MKATICDACGQATPMFDPETVSDYYKTRTMPMDWAEVSISHTGVTLKGKDYPCMVVNQVCKSCLDRIRMILKPHG